jgi:DNA-binding Lrp family transcriptional regulator
MLDSFDRRILTTLQLDGRIQNKDLADRIGLSAAPCLRRMRALERRGVIERYSAVVAPQKVGLSLVILASVRLRSQEREATQAFETAVAAWPNIVECHVMTGAFDYLLKVVARDIADYESFLTARLTRLKPVDKVESFVIMRTVKQSAIIPA